jgi:WD40 repeat protein
MQVMKKLGLTLATGLALTGIGLTQGPLSVFKEAKLTPRWQNADGHRSREWLIGFSKDGKLAFFEQDTKKIIARDTVTWKRTGQLLVNESDLKWPKSDYSVTSPDGTLTAFSVDAGRAVPDAYSPWDRSKKPGRDIVLRNTKTKAVVARAKAHDEDAHLLFTPDGKTLISAAHDTIIVWDLPTLTRLRTLGPVNTTPIGLFVTPAGDMLGMRCQGVSYEDQFWDLKTGVMSASLGGHARGNYPVQVWGLAFAPDGKTLASIGNDPQVRVWHVKTGLTALTVPIDFNSAHRVQQVAYSPDSKMLAVGEHSAVRLYDAATGKPGLVLEGHTSDINALAFSPDGKRIASLSGRQVARVIDREAEPGEIIVWDLQTKAKHVIKPYKQGGYAVAWSPDGSQLATGGIVAGADDKLKEGESVEALFVWDAKTGKLLRKIDTDQAGTALLAFNPDGKTIAHGGSQIRIVDRDTGKEVRLLRAGGNAMAFRKDGKLLAVAGGSGGFNSPNPGFIQLWDPHNGQRVAHQQGHQMQINAVVFHPDGNAIATAGNDGAIWMWDIVPVPK